jgi:hypothetical protein
VVPLGVLIALDDVFLGNLFEVIDLERGVITSPSLALVPKEIPITRFNDVEVHFGEGGPLEGSINRITGEYVARLRMNPTDLVWDADTSLICKSARPLF